MDSAGSSVEVTAEVHFAQQLASNQGRVKEKALKKLSKWLEVKSCAEGAFTEDGMLKMWKGIYYYFWNLDKPLVQEDKAAMISKFMHNFKRKSYSFLFMDTFFQTMSREWFAIDRFRLEKFMMLVRRFLRECFEFLKQTKWNLASVKRFRKILKKTVASPDSGASPLGLKLHVIDIYMEELARVGADELCPKTTKAFLVTFCGILAYANDPVLLGSIQRDIFLYLLNQDADEDMYGEFPILKFDVKLVQKLLTKWSEKEDVRKKNAKYILDIIKSYEEYSRNPEGTQVELPSRNPAKAIRKRHIEKSVDDLLKEEEEFRAEKLSWKKKSRRNAELHGDADDDDPDV